MRASRLMSLLFEIESRPGVTANQLADELGVTVRTVYRDVAALQSSGAPLYGIAGRGGGLHLVDGYRSRAVTLRAEEAAALLMGVVPVVAEQLGLGAPLDRAQRKLFAQLGDTVGADVELERSHVLIDPIGWYRAPDEAPHLAAIATALRTRTVVTIRYRRWQEPTLVRRRVEPHGLVLKAGVWYVMARHRGSIRTYRVNQIIAVQPSDTTFVPDGGFDLPTAWNAFVEQFRERLDMFRAEVRLTRAGRDWLRSEGDPAVIAAIAAAVGSSRDDEGPLVVSLPCESIERAASDILRLGLEADAVNPPELVQRVADIVAELAVRFAR